ncbi:MAG: phosphoribosylaminoimidazolesuccinocarboxamide synthase [Phycisphaeraceae bacterium]|nr:phosphoribosylaminoimidazolesuccinocarboxamide synthase [Phycisphaerales bacterium]MCB9860351.1 phosphoribosylaminoimidazolesuccinocarboxamide synthase [Phycisphaeraceae bacterium]
MPDTHTHSSTTSEKDSHSLIGTTSLRLPLIRSGKVRDVYRVPELNQLLLIATDRISAFDVVLPTLLGKYGSGDAPDLCKGQLLTQLSVFWLRWVEQQGLAETHLISHDADDIPDSAFDKSTTTRNQLRGRVMLTRACSVVPIECVVRGYLEGSGWRDYQKTGTVSGVRLPPGLRQCDRLPEPIFTPSTKADPPAHDEPVSYEQACNIVGETTMQTLRDQSLAIYSAASKYALERGIIIADTKFEFGIPIDQPDANPILIDEVLTPDSSRFWPVDQYEPGHAQPSYDKQFVREYLETLVAKNQWNKQPPGPALPDQIVEQTLARYQEAVQTLTARNA